MANPQQEIPIDDDDLNALMAELEEQTASITAKPAAPAPAAPVAEPPAAVEIPVETPPEAAAAPAPTEVDPTSSRDELSVEAEMAALEAELSAATIVATPATTLAVKVDETTGTITGMGTVTATSAPAPTTPPAAEPTPEHNPPPRRAQLEFFLDVEKFRDETAVSDTNLDSCMMQQAGLRAFYGAQAIYAEAQHDRVKARFKVLEAALYDEHRKAMLAAGDKVTEKAVENAVLADPRWLKGQNTVIEANTLAGVNRVAVDSLRDRKDMLVQLGADRREEGKGQLRVMEETNLRARAAAAGKAALPGSEDQT